MVDVRSLVTNETRHARLLLVLLVQAVSSTLGNTQYTTCDKLSNCSCRCGDHGVVDLSAVGLKNGEPRFKNMYDPEHIYQYSYNPCYDFTESDPSGWQNNCNGVASCQVISLKGIDQYFDCGQQSSVQFTLRPAKDVAIVSQDDFLVAEYTSKDNARITQVVLLCDHDGEDELTVLGQTNNPFPTYRFYLFSPSACYKSEGNRIHSLSVGSILLIGFACLLVTYLIVGMSYQKLVKKSTGKYICPNYNLWSNIPGQVKDGFFLAVNKLKGLCLNQYQHMK